MCYVLLLVFEAILPCAHCRCPFTDADDGDDVTISEEPSVHSTKIDIEVPSLSVVGESDQDVVSRVCKNPRLGIQKSEKH